jgi:predicted MFS family arabinose efflux permease
VIDNEHFLRRPGAWPIVALLLVYKAGETFASSVQKPFLVDQHFDLEAIGLMAGLVGSTAGIAGAMTGGFFVTRLGRRRSLVLFGLSQAIAVTGYSYLAMAPPSTIALYVVCTLETFASGAATAALFTCMMDWSERFSSGTDYTTQASTVVWAQLGFGVLGGFSAHAFGYATHFALASALCVVAVLCAFALFPTERRS